MSLKFIDLFAGLGGFHKALAGIGLECVFACEIDKNLQELYAKNYGIHPHGDIRSIDAKDIPPHDVLCAGFPCQPFSLAGQKKGTKCPASGTLIDDVIRIAKCHQPSHIFLENVPNILTIDNGKFWRYIEKSLRNIGYSLDYRIYCPTDFNIPQNRKRVFVIACHQSVGAEIKWPSKPKKTDIAINDFFRKLVVDKSNTKKLETRKENVLQLWHEIVNHIDELASHPIIASEFGANYPLTRLNKLTLPEIRKYKGAWGESLSKCKNWNEVYQKLPHYVCRSKGKPSDWTMEAVIYTRELYRKHQSFLKAKIKSFKLLPQSWQKIQWQGFRDIGKRNIWQHIIQFRPSGIRVIKPYKIPSLVSMTPTQIPIIASKKRYLAIEEAAALQSLETLPYLPNDYTKAFKAFGNAINSTIVKDIARNNLT